jgi:hypothetical protein
MERKDNESSFSPCIWLVGKLHDHVWNRMEHFWMLTERLRKQPMIAKGLSPIELNT